VDATREAGDGEDDGTATNSMTVPPALSPSPSPDPSSLSVFCVIVVCLTGLSCYK
jgi:hypothetical protein